MTIPTTIVGSANGRSTSALMTLRPRKRSRTRTQATSVPVTALMAAAASEHSSVRRSAATAWRPLTAAQSASRPPSVERATTAASGISTMTLRYSVASPRASAPEPPTAVPRARRRTAPAVRASLGSGDPRVRLDLRHRALVRVEELVVDLAPAAELVDREQARWHRELGGVALQHRLVDRPVAPVREALLRGMGEHVVEEGFARGGMLGFGDEGDRFLDQDRLVGDNVFDA